MIKLLERLLNDLRPMLLDSIGQALLIFGLLWLGQALSEGVRRRRPGLSSWPALAAAVGLLSLIYLGTSTPARRAYIEVALYPLGRALATVALGAGLAVGAAWGWRRLAQRTASRSAWSMTAGVALTYAIALPALYFMTFAPDLDQVTTAAPELANIHITDDLPIHVFEDQIIRKPTAMLVSPSGDIYVAGLDGSIWVMRDNHGVADQVREFAHGLHQPEGLALGPQGLYVTELGQVVRLNDTHGTGVADQTTVIVAGLPGEAYKFHQPNSLLFGPDGRLYIGVGATTDHRPEPHPLAARLLSVNPDGSDLRVSATGLRNPYAVIPAPGGGFFAIDNGPSGCVDTPRQQDDCSEKVPVPEELNYVREGRDYGFPQYTGIPPANSGTEPPVVTFPEHSAPAGLVQYTGDKLPAAYRGQLFVSLWARGEIQAVRVLRLDAEHFIGDTRTFVSGLAGPAALAVAPDGGLLVASFSASVIYWIGR